MKERDGAHIRVIHQDGKVLADFWNAPLVPRVGDIFRLDDDKSWPIRSVEWRAASHGESVSWFVKMIVGNN